MGILNKLVKENLIKNKQRTIVSIIGIILSCALITALFGLAVSFRESFIESSLKTYGNRHVTFKNVLKEDIEDIKQHKNVKSYYLSNIKVARNNKELVGVVGLNKDALSEFKNKLQEGLVPNNTNEIVIDKFYADDKDIKIGDELTVTTGERYSEGYLLDENNPYIDGETLENTLTKTYKVVGISSHYSYLSSKYDYSLYIFDKEISNKSNVHVLYNDPKNYDKITAQINGTKSDLDKGKYDISYNREYLRWSGYAIGDNSKNVITTMSFIIAFIIIITSVFCIRNSFAISVSEKTRTFGMLSSVGATPKQIKRSVLKEGFYLGIIGIPLGIISGVLASYILVIITRNMLYNMASESFEFIYKISFEAIIISIILSSITIYLSARGSAKKASKITEIEAIKNQKDIKLNSKKLKTPKIIKSLFKTGGVLAYKNMKRNKGKYRTTIVALAISITSFIAVSYFIQIGLKQSSNLLGDISFNISVNTVSHNPLEFEEKKKTYEYISKLNNVDDFSIIKEKTFYLDKKFIKDKNIKNDLMGLIFSLNKEEYDKFLNKSNLKYDDVKNKGIVVSNTYRDLDKNNKIKKIIEKDINNINYTNYRKTFKSNINIIFSDEIFMGLENYINQNMLIILVSEEYFKKINIEEYYNEMYIDSSNPSQLKKDIKEYEENLDYDLYIADITEIVNSQNMIILLVSIFLYGFITVITLIGLTNIFNTITTNMILREKEFAMLKSIGMTKKEFNNMIRLESIFYGVKSLFYGLIFGIGLSYLMYLSIKQSNFMIVDIFIPPYIPIIYSVIFVFLIINLIMKYSLNKINKQNIIETIKNENI